MNNDTIETEFCLCIGGPKNGERVEVAKEVDFACFPYLVSESQTIRETTSGKPYIEKTSIIKVSSMAYNKHTVTIDNFSETILAYEPFSCEDALTMLIRGYVDARTKRDD